MNNIKKKLIIGFAVIISIIAAILVYHFIETSNPDDTNNQLEEFYDENLDEKGWI